MTTQAALRDLVQAELDWIAESERDIFGAAAWSPELIRDDWAHGGRRYRVAEADGELAGYAVYGFDGDAFSLLNVAVLPKWRRRGIGRAFVEDFLGEAVTVGAREVWLEVAVTNDAAIALYRNFGFEDVRVRARYYQPEGTDALVMVRREPRR